MQYHTEDDSDSSIEEKEEEYSSSDDEDQEVMTVKKETVSRIILTFRKQMHVTRRKTQWSGGEYDPFSTSGQTETEVDADKLAVDDQKDNEEDPFGGFTTGSNNSGAGQATHWEDGFASNFADMDLSTVKISPDKRTESTINA